MNNDELEWITNRHEGEKIYFKSQYGDIDTLTILEVCFYNSLNPINWGYYNTSSIEYTAHAQVRYGFKNRKDGGIMEIWKLSNGKAICFSSVLLDSNWLNEVQLKTTCLKINGAIINDIMLFETATTNKRTKNSLVSYAWSKTYGLVQYTFRDGTIFSRIDIGNVNQRSCGIAHEFGHVVLYLNGQPHSHSNNADYIYERQWNVMKRFGYDYLE